jgi:predicted phosphodiesterase
MDAGARGVAEIVVAGDLVGFGAQPNEVIDLLVSRGVVLIAGNHEQDYVAGYQINENRQCWQADPRLAAMCWYLDRLGADRSALLAALPTQHWLDEIALVVHGSTRHIRDGVRAETPEDELDRMFTATTARLVFVGHTHVPVLREMRHRRIVNVGSVGAPLGGDPRATYAITTRCVHVDADWSVDLCRVPYAVEEAIAAYGQGMGAVDPGFAAIMARQLRTGDPYLNGWLRVRARTPGAELDAPLTRYLAAHT